ncbi:hypothetical protein CERZMDRAFT_85032 [Cercospora zeae-maydis SCOH1-5]|uniref:Uncharacterized protein n=1 Tax=Cercospora zeae-maydis SCOH1-5 TaxID=717836 RepID=A0A6A6FF42_9PEZI|nr:hypothetical protein CERZMDRAFT_85032 [Cercospora zeae-maydis SCOH1-5]
MYESQTESIARFSRLGHLSTAQLAQFSKDIDTLRPRNYQDNREVRRSAVRNIVEGLQLVVEDAAAMVSDLMMLADAMHCQRVSYRDPHPPARGYRRPTRNQLPTPDPTPYRQLAEPLPRSDVSWPEPPTPAPWMTIPTQQETVNSLTLENRMLRATLTERDYEIFELELGLARAQVEAMSEREKRYNLRRRFRDLADQED